MATGHLYPTSAKSRDRGDQKGSILVVYMTKRSRGVLGVMRGNEIIWMQQSMASAAVNWLGYSGFCGPWGGLQGIPRCPWGVPRRSQGCKESPRSPF